MVELFESDKPLDLDSVLNELACESTTPILESEIFKKLGRHYSPGEMIIMEEDFSSTVFLVIKGKVKVTKRSYMSGEKEIGYLGSGEIFGEMAYIDNQPRSANVFAEEESDIIVLDRDHFDLIFKLHPPVWTEKLITSLANKVSLSYEELLSNKNIRSNLDVRVEQNESPVDEHTITEEPKSRLARIIDRFKK